MKDLAVRARISVLLFFVVSFSAEILAAGGCDPYDELRCTRGYDWSNCRCIGEQPPAPSASARQATQDIVARAGKDNRFGRPISGTNGEMLSWSPDWELRWVDFQFIGNRQVRIFHATYKSNRSIRYTIYFDPVSNQWSGWQTP